MSSPSKVKIKKNSWWSRGFTVTSEWGQLVLIKVQTWGHSGHNSIYLMLGLCFLVFLYKSHVLTMHGAPPGSDPGNWMAFGHELFGESVKAATVPYPPLIPALSKGFGFLFSPITGMSILGAIVSVAIGIPFFLIAKQSAGGFWALLFTFALLFLSYSSEMANWGGYPQILSQALLLLTLYFLGKGLLQDRRGFVLLATLPATLTTGTSVLGFVLLTTTAGIFFSIAVIKEDIDTRKSIARFLEWATATFLLSLVFLPVYLRTVELRDQAGGFNPHGYTLATAGDALTYLFRDWPGVTSGAMFMLPIIIILGVYCLWGPTRGSIMRLVAPSLMISSALAFITTLEVRTLSLLPIAMLGAMTVLFPSLLNQIRRKLHRTLLLRLVETLVILSAVTIVAITAQLGYTRDYMASRWYLVADTDTMVALDWLRRHQHEGGRVVASLAFNDNNLAWWVEGYAKLPTYSATDPKWLNIEEERKQGKIARSFFSSTATPSQIMTLTEQHGFRYLLIDRRVSPDISLFLEANYVPVVDNATVILLRYESALN